MKRTSALFLVSVLFLGAFQGAAFGQEIEGQIVSSIQERLNLSQGDRLVINLGRSTGIIKGDYGRIIKSFAVDPSDTAGRCAVVEVRDTTILCQVYQVKAEIEVGDRVFLRALSFSQDAAFQEVAIGFLNSVVAPYEPSKQIIVHVLPIYDDANNVTGLSQKIRRELVDALRQKPRISPSQDSSLKELVLYPDDDLAWIWDARDALAKAGADVLIVGKYRIEGGQVLLKLFKVDRNFDDSQITMRVPFRSAFESMAAQVVTPYRKVEKKEPVTCWLFVRPQMLTPAKEEKQQLMKAEAAGNPFVAANLKRVDFNILSPVDVVVQVDGQVVDFKNKDQQSLSLKQGMHRVSASFKRGFFSNESLLYTSGHAFAKEILMDLSRSKTIGIEIAVNPMQEKGPITFNVYAPVERERQVLHPIYRVESDRVLETYRD
jgi:hypothetical protein